MKVKFFAQLQSFAGCEEIDVPAERPMTAVELWAILEKRFPGIDRHKNATRLARNFAYADNDSVFQNGDEVALIPPVSGG